MSTKSAVARTIAALWAGLIEVQANAAPLELGAPPAGTAYKAPAPNVIVSVDNASRMETAALAALKGALQKSMDDISDGAIRLGWQSTSAELRAIQPLDKTTRADFKAWIAGLAPLGDSPAHRMITNAGEHLTKPIDLHSAWASVPGQKLAPVLACRRAYHLYIAGGGWDAVQLPQDPPHGDADSTPSQMPDGTAFDPTNEAVRIYRGKHPAIKDAAGLRMDTTLSDLAFHYWSRDLQPALANELKPKILQHGTSSHALPEYWNPRNNPATWQHMSTHAIGVDQAASWKTRPHFGADTWTGGDYGALLSGELEWPDPLKGNDAGERIADLWHIAINGRGSFVPAPDGPSLRAALDRFFDDILSTRIAPVTSLRTSTRSARFDAGLFAASFDALDWSGAVTAYRIRAGTAALDAVGLWGDVPAAPATDSEPARPPRPHSTATLMDAHGQDWHQTRLVLSAASESPEAAPVGISWEWDRLSESQRTALKSVDGVLDTRSTAEATARNRMAYLRGDRSLEQSATPAGPFRGRGSRHGDIVNSKLWYAPGRPASAHTQGSHAGFRSSMNARVPMLYVGANDGMLHGFDATTGAERIAYVPDGLHARLAELTRPSYGHSYFVDGSPLTGDVHVGPAASEDPSGWRTYLAGFPGAGGRGYFVLDVTDPATFVADNAANLVVMDRTATTAMDRDIGHIFGEPVTEAANPQLSRQITRMNDGRWALVTGNGYNSADEKAVLLIQYLDLGKELLKIVADGTSGNSNGLSPPRLIDLNGDRIPDVAYAGDLLGNLWKFDLSSHMSYEWKVSFAGAPLFVAQSGVSPASRQPITTAPVWKAHPAGGLMLAFGTGRLATATDRSDAATQTVYGIYDSTPFKRKARVEINDNTAAITRGRDELVEQTVGPASTATANASHAFWTISSHAVRLTGSNARRGWFLDLPLARERVVKNPEWFEGDLIDVWSTVPADGTSTASESCNPAATAARGFRTIIDIFSGSAPKSQLYTDADAAATSGQASRVEADEGAGVRTESQEFRVSAPGLAPGPTLTRLGKTLKRPGWRQLQ